MDGGNWSLEGIERLVLESCGSGRRFSMKSCPRILHGYPLGYRPVATIHSPVGTEGRDRAPVSLLFNEVTKVPFGVESEEVDGGWDFGRRNGSSIDLEQRMCPTIIFQGENLIVE